MFDTNSGISQQLALGCRSFFFNIDYLTNDMNRENFSRPYEPALLYRDNSGNLISNNSGALDNAFKHLAEYGFNDQMPNYNDPIIVFLHFVRTPDKLTETDRYVTFLKKVSLSLNVLNNRFAKEYYRSSRESDIFTQDIHTLTINTFARPMQQVSSSNTSFTSQSIDNLANNTDERYVYITGINIHDDNLNVIARTNIAQPIVKYSSDKILFKFKMDF